MTEHAHPVLSFPFDAVKQHLSSDKAQEEEADVRPERIDIAADGTAQKIADQRHQELEEAKIQAHPQRVAQSERPQRQAVGDRDGQGIH